MHVTHTGVSHIETPVCVSIMHRCCIVELCCGHCHLGMCCVPMLRNLPFVRVYCTNMVHFMPFGQWGSVCE